MAEFYQELRRNNRDRRRRLAFIRSKLTDKGGTFVGGYENRMVYTISRNPCDDREQYPWRVTTFTRSDDGELLPCGHTVHQFLDLKKDHGAYYKSAVWEICSSVSVD